MSKIESIKKVIEGKPIDEQIARVEDAIWMLSMKDHWSNEESAYDSDLSKLLKELKEKTNE